MNRDREGLTLVSLSLRVQRVRLALTMKGVSFDVINCDLKNKPRFFVEANPVGEVPVLIHNGVFLTESEVCVGETRPAKSDCM